MGVCLICLAWAALWLRSPCGRVLNMFGVGRTVAVAALWSVCSICLAWAALWLRSPYGRVLNMFGTGRPMAAVFLWACASYVWHGPPYGCGRPVGVCLICLAYLPASSRRCHGHHNAPNVTPVHVSVARAALWLRSPYGRVLNMFGMGRLMAAAALWGVCSICLA